MFSLYVVQTCKYKQTFPNKKSQSIPPWKQKEPGYFQLGSSTGPLPAQPAACRIEPTSQNTHPHYTCTPWQRNSHFFVKVPRKSHQSDPNRHTLTKNRRIYCQGVSEGAINGENLCISNKTTYICLRLHAFRERCGERLSGLIEK